MKPSLQMAVNFKVLPSDDSIERLNTDIILNLLRTECLKFFEMSNRRGRRWQSNPVRGGVYLEEISHETRRLFDNTCQLICINEADSLLYIIVER